MAAKRKELQDEQVQRQEEDRQRVALETEIFQVLVEAQTKTTELSERLRRTISNELTSLEKPDENAPSRKASEEAATTPALVLFALKAIDPMLRPSGQTAAGAKAGQTIRSRGMDDVMASIAADVLIGRIDDNGKELDETQQHEQQMSMFEAVNIFHKHKERRCVRLDDFRAAVEDLVLPSNSAALLQTAFAVEHGTLTSLERCAVATFRGCKSIQKQAADEFESLMTNERRTSNVIQLRERLFQESKRETRKELQMLGVMGTTSSGPAEQKGGPRLGATDEMSRLREDIARSKKQQTEILADAVQFEDVCTSLESGIEDHAQQLAVLKDWMITSLELAKDDVQRGTADLIESMNKRAEQREDRLAELDARLTEVGRAVVLTSVSKDPAAHQEALKRSGVELDWLSAMYDDCADLVEEEEGERKIAAELSPAPPALTTKNALHRAVLEDPAALGMKGPITSPSAKKKKSNSSEEDSASSSINLCALLFGYALSDGFRLSPTDAIQRGSSNGASGASHIVKAPFPTMEALSEVAEHGTMTFAQFVSLIDGFNVSAPGSTKILFRDYADVAVPPPVNQRSSAIGGLANGKTDWDAFWHADPTSDLDEVLYNQHRSVSQQLNQDESPRPNARKVPSTQLYPERRMSFPSFFRAIHDLASSFLGHASKMLSTEYVLESFLRHVALTGFPRCIAAVAQLHGVNMNRLWPASAPSVTATLTDYLKRRPQEPSALLHWMQLAYDSCIAKGLTFDESLRLSRQQQSGGGRRDAQIAVSMRSWFLLCETHCESHTVSGSSSQPESAAVKAFLEKQTSKLREAATDDSATVCSANVGAVSCLLEEVLREAESVANITPSCEIWSADQGSEATPQQSRLYETLRCAQASVAAATSGVFAASGAGAILPDNAQGSSIEFQPFELLWALSDGRSDKTDLLQPITTSSSPTLSGATELLPMLAAPLPLFGLLTALAQFDADANCGQDRAGGAQQQVPNDHMLVKSVQQNRALFDGLFAVHHSIAARLQLSGLASPVAAARSVGGLVKPSDVVLDHLSQVGQYIEEKHRR